MTNVYTNMKAFLMVFICALGLVAFAGPMAQIDDSLAKKATVVVRAKRLQCEGGDKYAWFEVQLLKVLKNDSQELLGEKLRVAAYSTDPGIPGGESTLYLEKYHPEQRGLWKLVGGKAATGVSHVGQ